MHHLAIFLTCVNKETSVKHSILSHCKVHFFFSSAKIMHSTFALNYIQNEAGSLDRFNMWNFMCYFQGVRTVTDFQTWIHPQSFSYFYIPDIKERKMMSGLLLCNQDIATFPSAINKHFKSEKAECWACVWLHVYAWVFKVCQHMKAWKTPGATLMVSRINNIDQTALMC